jgi:leucyl aminopeptidase
VLADVIWYAAKRFKPKFMIDLATLTGAIIVALGQEYAGMFANNDQLAERLSKAGEATGEKVWRMPLSAEYDKMIDSKFADMKNTGGSRWGGAITAAWSCSASSTLTPWAISISRECLARRNQINHSWGLGLWRSPARSSRRKHRRK